MAVTDPACPSLHVHPLGTSAPLELTGQDTAVHTQHTKIIQTLYHLMNTRHQSYEDVTYQICLSMHMHDGYCPQHAHQTKHCLWLYTHAHFDSSE